MKSKVNPKVFKGLFIYGMVLFFTIALIITIFFTPIFNFNSATVQYKISSQFIKVDEVKATVEQYDGKPITMINYGELNKKLEQLKGVFKANTSIKFPNSITVDIVPSTAVATALLGDKIILVDANGKVFGYVKVDNKTYDNLPKIELGDSAEINKNLVELFSFSSDLGQDIQYAKVIGGKNYQVTLKGFTVNLGKYSDLNNKISIVKRILDNNEFRGKNIIDVSNPASPLLQ
jgi:cell division septal protein FtsQ